MLQGRESKEGEEGFIAQDRASGRAIYIRVLSCRSQTPSGQHTTPLGYDGFSQFLWK